MMLKFLQVRLPNKDEHCDCRSYRINGSIGIIIAVIFYDTIKNAEDVQKYLGLSILGKYRRSKVKGDKVKWKS